MFISNLRAFTCIGQIWYTYEQDKYEKWQVLLIIISFSQEKTWDFQKIIFSISFPIVFTESNFKTQTINFGDQMTWVIDIGNILQKVIENNTESLPIDIIKKDGEMDWLSLRRSDEEKQTTST